MTRRLTLRQAWLPALITALGLSLRFYRLAAVPLIRDEAYYWLWSRHLDWAFVDHPAGVAVLTWLSAALGGQGEAGIRWLNALLSASCIPLVYWLGRRMLSRQAGLLAAVAVAVGAPFVLTGRHVYTDALQLFLMLLTLHTFWSLVAAGERQAIRPAQWMTFGLSCALLLNTKYSAYLLVLALMAALLLDHRWLLRRPGFWLAAALAALGLLPVVLWNGTHEWVSFRWQLSHMGFSLRGPVGFRGLALHARSYLTWPLVALALLGLARLRRPSERLLSLVALFLLVPLLVSGTDSPRNLVNGMVALLLLGGQTWSAGTVRTGRWLLRGAMTLLLVATAIFGVGTVLDLLAPSHWPSSSSARTLREESVGMRALGADLASYTEPVFSPDYALAGTIWYYSRKPAYTSWTQYRLWGMPQFRDVVLVSQGYISPELIGERLDQAFKRWSGPHILRYTDQAVAREIRVWQAEGLRLSQEEFLSLFDFLNLYRAGP